MFKKFLILFLTSFAANIPLFASTLATFTDPLLSPYRQLLPGSRFHHNPYGTADNSLFLKIEAPSPSSSATTEESLQSQHLTNSPGVFSSHSDNSTSPASFSGTQPHPPVIHRKRWLPKESTFHDHIVAQLDSLGDQEACDETVKKYQLLIDQLHLKLSDQTLSDYVKFNTMNNLAFAKLGLSNVFGKLHNNQAKYELSEQAFLIYVTLSATSFVSPFPRDAANHKAGTCFLIMNDAIFYMERFSSEVHSLFLSRFLEIARAHIPTEGVMPHLLSRLGKQLSGFPKNPDSISSIIIKTAFQSP